MIRRIVALVLLVLFVAAPAHADGAQVDVILMEGVIDDAKVDYLLNALEEAAAESQAVILKVNSAGAVTNRVTDLADAVADSPVPVVAWIGDTPAKALGGAASVVAAADLLTASPGATIGHREYVTIGAQPIQADGASFGEGDLVTIDVDTPGFDRVEGSLGQIVVWLDGQTIDGVMLETAEEITDDDGNTRLQQTVSVRFVEPNLWVRTLNAALSPAALFFFIAAGLTIVAFEFYAIGPGVAAGTALLPLLVAGYGIAQLPITWHGAALLLFSIWLFVLDYQTGGFRIRSWLATVLLAVSGYLLVDGAPTLTPSIGAILTTTIAIALFFSIAMPVVARSRFSTGTFGRDHLIGRHGSAVGAFTEGTGVIDLGGAQWKASAHREAGIADGDDLVVAAVSGLWLEVERPESESATPAETQD